RHVRSAAASGAADHVGEAVAVHVAGRDADAAGEVQVVGEEVVEDGTVLATEDGDVGPAAGVGADDDVGVAVAVDVAGGHVGAAGASAPVAKAWACGGGFATDTATAAELAAKLPLPP